MVALGLRPGPEHGNHSCLAFAFFLQCICHCVDDADALSTGPSFSSSSVPADDEDNLQEWIERRRARNAGAEEDRVDGPRDDRVDNIRDDRVDNRRNNLRSRDVDGELSDLNHKKQELQRKLERLRNDRDPPSPRPRSRSENPFVEPEAQAEEKLNSDHESEDNIIIDGYEPAEANGVFRVMQMEPDSEIDRRIAEAEAKLTARSAYDLQVARRDYLHRLESGVYVDEHETKKSGVYDEHEQVPRDQEEQGSKRQRRF